MDVLAGFLSLSAMVPVSQRVDLLLMLWPTHLCTSTLITDGAVQAVDIFKVLHARALEMSVLEYTVDLPT